MIRFSKVLFSLILITLFVTFVDVDLLSQCPMCKMSAEQNLKDGGTAAKGLNKGILYMLTLPYLLVFGLGYLWFKNRKKLSDEIYDQPISDN